MVFRIPRSLNCDYDPGRQGFDLGEIVRREFDSIAVGIFVRERPSSRAWNRHDPWLRGNLGKQPGQSELRGCYTFTFRNSTGSLPAALLQALLVRIKVRGKMLENMRKT